MSAVLADPAAGSDVPLKRGEKKLLVIVIAALLIVLLAGGGVFYLRHKAARAAAEALAADGGDGAGAAESLAAADAHDSHTPPTYLPLDPFIINLADRESDRYAQIGITLEVQSPAFAEQMKTYMPAVRNAILMVITRKTSRELLEPMGKEQLADEIMREAVRPMGIEIAAPVPVTAAPMKAAPEPGASAASGVASIASIASIASGASGAAKAATHLESASAPKKARRRDTVTNPIQHVNFSSFIIQ